MAEAADQAEAVKLARALLETADEEHLLVEIEQLVLRRLVALRLRRPLAVRLGRRRGLACRGSPFRGCCLRHPALSAFSLSTARLYGGKAAAAQRAQPPHRSADRRHLVEEIDIAHRRLAVAG